MSIVGTRPPLPNEWEAYELHHRARLAIKPGIYEHYTENNPVEKNTDAGKAAKAKENELEKWLRGLDGMDCL